MAHVDHSTDPMTGLTVYSLYGASEKDLAPRRELLRNLDALVIDLQDIGSRYYTFIYTITCTPASAAARVQRATVQRKVSYREAPRKLDAALRDLLAAHPRHVTRTPPLPPP